LVIVLNTDGIASLPAGGIYNKSVVGIATGDEALPNCPPAFSRETGRRGAGTRWSGAIISNPNPRHHRQVANRVRRVKNHALDFRTPSNRIPGRIAVTHPITLPRSLIKPEHVLALGTCVEQLGDTSIGKAGRSRSTQVRLRQSRSKRLLAILPLYSYRSAV
jgi:hypothetical protein